MVMQIVLLLEAERVSIKRIELNTNTKTNYELDFYFVRYLNGVLQNRGYILL